MKSEQSEPSQEQEAPEQFLQVEENEQMLPFAVIKHHWNQYFSTVPPQNLNPALSLHKLIIAFRAASAQNYFESLFVVNEYSRQYYEASLDYPSVLKKLASISQDGLAAVILEIMNSIECDAWPIIQTLRLVLHSYLIHHKGKSSKKVCLVIENFPQSDISQIKAHSIDHFITFEAVVIKVHQVRLMPVSVDFECTDCKDSFTHYLTEGIYTLPKHCLGTRKKGCKGKVFNMCKDRVRSIFSQRLRVQEIDSAGRNPRQVNCQLRENIVGKAITGQTVKISGIVRTETTQKDKKTQGMYMPFVIVNSITQKTNSSLDQDEEDLIKEMSSNPNIFFSLLKSFCLAIYGHELVKSGLILGIIGGSGKNLSDESTFRETSHILLLGDPGIGKSQLLKFTVELMPHSIYVNATATSTSGLTVTVNRQNNQQTLQAGALILADNGICAIDEFDKIGDSSSLLEAMEQQTVSIAKAGVICQLKCRVGVVASANPVHGCYNKGKSFKDNTKISNAILSRFDLIFLLVDKPDPQRDQKLAEHIMKIHNKNRKRRVMGENQVVSKVGPRHMNISQYDEYLSLNDKYAKLCETERITYSLEQMKKYLSWVKREVHPVLSREAAEVIKGFYLVLRENSPNTSFQITNRQLESMVRLSMARARIQGRNVVTEADAVEITQLMQESLFDSFEEMGYNINSLKYEVKKAKVFKKNSELSLPKQRALFINAMRDKGQQRESGIWEWNDLVKLAKELQLNIADFWAFIDRLNQEGTLLQKGNKKYLFKDSYV